MERIGDYHVSADVVVEGAQGTVVEGYHVHSKKPVAVKIFKNVSRRTIEREIACYEALISGSCTKTVPVYDWYIYKNTGYLMMQRMSSDLLDMIQANSKISEKKVQELFPVICQAVRECHTNKIAHMDIKPDNILLDAYGKPFLCDYGNAVIDPDGKIVGCRGTKLYAAPEVILGYYYDPYKADIWNLGTTLYVMLTGLLPNFLKFDTKEEYALIVKDMISTLNSMGISSQCVDLIGKLLTVKPSQRITIAQVLKHPYLSKRRILPRVLRKAKSLAGLPSRHNLNSILLNTNKD